MMSDANQTSNLATTSQQQQQQPGTSQQQQQQDQQAGQDSNNGLQANRGRRNALTPEVHQIGPIIATEMQVKMSGLSLDNSQTN